MGPSAQPGVPSPGRLASWVRQGVESFAAAQRILLDLTAQQNALAIGMLRERVKLPQIRPMASLIDVANRAITGLAGAGDILLDLAAGETTVAVDGVKEALRLGTAGGAVADVVRHRALTLIEMQRRLLDGVAAQMQEVAASYEEGKGLTGGASLSELARRAMEGFVETEKKFLDLVSEEVNAATAPGGARKPSRDRSKVLTQLAREGVEKYIDAQKELLELAIRQISANGKTSRERAEAARAAREELRTSFAELTRKSVKNFVNAEMSLLEMAVKPPKRPVKAAKATKAQRKPRPRKAPAAKGAAAAAEA